MAQTEIQRADKAEATRRFHNLRDLNLAIAASMPGKSGQAGSGFTRERKRLAALINP